MATIQRIDTEQLENKIKESGLREDYIYKTLDMTRATWIDKKKGRKPFRVPEVYMLCDILSISDSDEKNAIFYPTE